MGHTYALTSFECEETFAITRLTNFAVILTKRHYLRCSGERTIDSIRGCYKNQIQADWPRLPAILILRLEILQSMMLKLFEQKLFLSNCRKQLVTPHQSFDKKKYFNLTCLSLTNYSFSRIGSALPKLKTAFYRSHFGHCAIVTKYFHEKPIPIRKF